jgi:transaldolase
MVVFKEKNVRNSYFFRVQAQTPTRFWINNVTREQAQLAINNGAVGCTQNPSYVWKMMTHPAEKDYVMERLHVLMLEEADNNLVVMKLQKELVGEVARIFKPLYDSSGGKLGYVSIQGDPFHEDKKTILDFAKLNREAGENIMCKIPAIPSGFSAMELLMKEYVPINVTECMTVRQVIDTCELYQKTTYNMVNPAPLYYSMITGIFDEYMYRSVKNRHIDVSDDIIWQSGMAVAKKAYELVKQKGYDCHFIGGGARNIHHFTEMVGADCAVTINWAGTADKLLEKNLPVVSRFFNPVSSAVVDELMEKIPEFACAYSMSGITPDEYEDYGPVVLFRSSFEASWKKSLDLVASER